MSSYGRNKVLLCSAECQAIQMFLFYSDQANLSAGEAYRDGFSLLVLDFGYFLLSKAAW